MRGRTKRAQERPEIELRYMRVLPGPAGRAPLVHCSAGPGFTSTITSPSASAGAAPARATETLSSGAQSFLDVWSQCWIETARSTASPRASFAAQCWFA